MKHDERIRSAPELRSAAEGDAGPADGDADEEVEAAWADEIARRLHEIDAGTVRPIPWAEARRGIRLKGR